MDKELNKCLESWKKTRLLFFIQNVQKVQKMFGIMKFSPISEQNNFIIFFNYRGARPPSNTVFVGDFVFTPLRRPSAPGHGWKTFDWNSNQLVLVYNCLTFLKQVRFLNFKFFFCYNFDTNCIGVLNSW